MYQLHRMHRDCYVCPEDNFARETRVARFAGVNFHKHTNNCTCDASRISVIALGVELPRPASLRIRHICSGTVSSSAGTLQQQRCFQSSLVLGFEFIHWCESSVICQLIYLFSKIATFMQKRKRSGGLDSQQSV
uniref:Uncharacterized protein n=1 Tax=Physcomitrium patens TaxID=3218 RepID=A0A2K1KL27_PHYPA|nr:hypothetical protein PHYPA_008157 [Physcomitrium patens]